MAVITDKKLAKFAGYALGQIVPDSEFEAMRAKRNAELAGEREKAYRAALRAPESGKWVVSENYTVNGRTMVRGTVLYVTGGAGVSPDGTDRYRLQHGRSRQTVFATDSMANIRAHCVRCDGRTA